MMLQDLQAHLASALPGTTIKYGFMPKSPIECLVLYAYAGSPPQYTLAGGRTARPGLQLVARSATLANAFNRIKSAQAVLEAVINQSVGTSFYRRVAPIQEPFGLPGWTEDAIILAQNYAVEMEEA